MGREIIGKCARLRGGLMTFNKFLDDHYKPEPGTAVSLASLTKHFYETGDSFSWPPDRIRRHLETRFPVGSLNAQTCVGNIRGPIENFQESDRGLVHYLGMLVPRDYRPDEFPIVRKLVEMGAREQARIEM